MSRERTKLLLAVDVLGRWSAARYQARRARGTVKRSSIGVDVETLRRLQAMAVEMAQLAEGAEWRYRVPSLAELLEWLSRGVVIAPDADLTRACRHAIADTHARVDRPMHAESDVG